MNLGSHCLLEHRVLYFISVAKHESKARLNASDTECQRFAEQFADMILDPKRPWLIQYLLVKGFETVPTWDELESDEFALTILNKLQDEPWLWETWFYEALQIRDRGKLVPYFKKLAIDTGLNKDHFERLLAVGKSSVIRQSLKKLGKRFSFHPRPKAKLPVWRYSESTKLLRC
jgi:hypothetical protein